MDLNKYIGETIILKNIGIIYIFNIELFRESSSKPYKNLVHMFRNGRLYSNFTSNIKFKCDVKITEDNKI